MAETPSDPNRDPDRPALDGEPGAATTLRYCRKCAAEVVPEGKGKCPRCGEFLRMNFVARRHKVNVLRRDIIEAELVAEFTPTTVVARASCAHLAATLEQLETMRPGTTEWQRLVTTAQTLGAALHDARPTPAPNAIEQVPSSALAYAKSLLLREATLSERDLGVLDYLRAAIRGEVRLPADPTPTPDPADPTRPGRETAAGELVGRAIVERSGSPYPPETAPGVAAPGSGPRLDPAADAALKAASLDAWLVLHGNEPEAIELRDAEATAVMMRQVGKTSPYV